MVWFYITFQSWVMAFILERVFKRYDPQYPNPGTLEQREQIWDERKEVCGLTHSPDPPTNVQVNGLIDSEVQHRALATSLPPELILLILRYIPYRIRPQFDVFTDIIYPSRSFRSLDVAAVAAPRICSSWNAPGTEALYEHITLYTEAQCILLKRTLQDVPSLRHLIRFLRLPSPREGSIAFRYKATHCRATPASVVRLSADILAACQHVEEVDVLQHASNITFLNSFQALTIYMRL